MKEYLSTGSLEHVYFFVNRPKHIDTISDEQGVPSREGTPANNEAVTAPVIQPLATQSCSKEFQPPIEEEVLCSPLDLGPEASSAKSESQDPPGESNPSERASNVRAPMACGLANHLGKSCYSNAALQLLLAVFSDQDLDKAQQLPDGPADFGIYLPKPQPSKQAADNSAMASNKTSASFKGSSHELRDRQAEKEKDVYAGFSDKNRVKHARAQIRDVSEANGMKVSPYLRDVFYRMRDKSCHNRMGSTSISSVLFQLVFAHSSKKGERAMTDFDGASRRDVGVFITLLMDRLFEEAEHPFRRERFLVQVIAESRCQCGSTSSTVEESTCLHVVAPARQIYRLDNLLASAETSMRSSRLQCKACGAKVPTSEASVMVTAPEFLLVYIDRDDSNRGPKSKINKVNIMLSESDIKFAKASYGLEAVIRHGGRSHHVALHTTIRKEGSLWYYCDDERVSQVSWENIVTEGEHTDFEGHCVVLLLKRRGSAPAPMLFPESSCVSPAASASHHGADLSIGDIKPARSNAAKEPLEKTTLAPVASQEPKRQASHATQKETNGRRSRSVDPRPVSPISIRAARRRRASFPTVNRTRGLSPDQAEGFRNLCVAEQDLKAAFEEFSAEALAAGKVFLKGLASTDRCLEALELKLLALEKLAIAGSAATEIAGARLSAARTTAAKLRAEQIAAKRLAVTEQGRRWQNVRLVVGAIGLLCLYWAS